MVSRGVISWFIVSICVECLIRLSGVFIKIDSMRLAHHINISSWEE